MMSAYYEVKNEDDAKRVCCGCTDNSSTDSLQAEREHSLPGSGILARDQARRTCAALATCSYWVSLDPPIKKNVHLQLAYEEIRLRMFLGWYDSLDMHPHERVQRDAPHNDRELLLF